MCGICGIVGFGAAAPGEEAEGRVSRMLAALAHRGPDRTGVHSGKAAVFGATRLAIRAPAFGDQPMVAADGLMAVCNGEIDNHHDLRRLLMTRGREVGMGSDIEVILPLYEEFGEGFVGLLVGVFALALWDSRSNQLLLARDRVGERPLFFAHAPDEMVFASEVAALTTHPGLTLHVDRRAVATYLWRGSFPAPDTPFAEVSKVRPGEQVVIDRAGIRRERYWRWGITREPKCPPSEDEFARILHGAVARQTDVDVEYGVFLSGGLDSSLIAAVTRAVRPDVPLRAYTIRFNEPSYDEGGFAQRVARLFGIDCAPVRIHADDFPCEIASLVALTGEPSPTQPGSRPPSSRGAPDAT